MAAEVSTPPLSRASSTSSSGTKRRHSPSLSLDLSDLPALSSPSPPSNTLLITNLNDPLIFTESNLSSIKSAIEAQVPLYSFSPLKSFRRIIVTFPSVSSAIEIRKVLDGETVLGHRVRVYFGETTDIAEKDNHLAAPEAKKLFFISPPPSPPMGWESRDEEPPNKEVHAEDLASALARVNEGNAKRWENEGESVRKASVVGHRASGSGMRSRSSTIVFDPADHGAGAVGLPAIAVDDFADEGEEDEDVDMEDAGLGGGRIPVHTARPPVELME